MRAVYQIHFSGKPYAPRAAILRIFQCSLGSLRLPLGLPYLPLFNLSFRWIQKSFKLLAKLVALFNCLPELNLPRRWSVMLRVNVESHAERH
ncbi:hypothetical protein ALP75_205452 [Pseudomonas syringae pv. actinidiae]|nr:hypothetical protein ALP75_205452 [Pseudomonas syringae pv. actinidiae]